MPIIGMKFNSIEGRTGNEKGKKEIKINSTPRITSIKDITISPFNEKVLSMSFEFLTTYTPKIGEIKITGELLYTSDKNKQILAQWKQKKSLPEDASIEILNYLFRRCLLKASVIAEELQLPLPLSLPRIALKKSNQSS